MKKYFATFLSALMALSLAACGTDTSAGEPAEAPAEGTEETTEAAPEAPDANATAVTDIKLADTENLVEVTSYELQSMDYVVSAKTEDHEYNANFVDGLLENDTYGNLKDCIAESYEQSEDGLTWTFHLKKGIMWVTADGEEYDEVKAEDFVTGLRHGVEFNSETAWPSKALSRATLSMKEATSVMLNGKRSASRLSMTTHSSSHWKLRLLTSRA